MNSSRSSYNRIFHYAFAENCVLHSVCGVRLPTFHLVRNRSLLRVEISREAATRAGSLHSRKGMCSGLCCVSMANGLHPGSVGVTYVSNVYFIQTTATNPKQNILEHNPLVMPDNRL